MDVRLVELSRSGAPPQWDIESQEFDAEFITLRPKKIRSKGCSERHCIYCYGERRRPTATQRFRSFLTDNVMHTTTQTN
jgi:hypothetical protein